MRFLCNRRHGYLVALSGAGDRYLVIGDAVKLMYKQVSVFKFDAIVSGISES